MEFEAALLSPGSPKRRRCAPLPGPTPGLRPPDAEPPPLQMQTPPASLQQPAPPGSERRLPTPGNLRCCCGLGRKPGRGVGGGEGAGVVDASRDHLSTPYRPWEKKELGCCWARLLPGTRDIREGQRPHSVGFRISWSLGGGHQDEVGILQATEGSWCPWSLSCLRLCGTSQEIQWAMENWILLTNQP